MKGSFGPSRFNMYPPNVTPKGENKSLSLGYSQLDSVVSQTHNTVTSAKAMV